MNNQFKSIAGLRGTSPVGCVLRIGRKHPERGFPIDRHRFYICKTTMEGKKNNARRPMHPSFNEFNELNGPKDSHPASMVAIRLAHVDRDSCFQAHLRAQVDPRRNRAAPGMRPWCTGDGNRAQRWDFKAETFRGLACPNDHCEFRQEGTGSDGKGKACKPNSRLLGQLVWPNGENMPSMLMRFSNNSWFTSSNLLGFFDYMDEIAVDLTKKGADLVDFTTIYNDDGEEKDLITSRRYSLLGFRLTLTVQEKSDSLRGRNYPVVTFTPIDDPLQHLLSQAVTMRQLSEAGHAAKAMLTDSEHTAQGGDHGRATDFLANEVGTATDGIEDAEVVSE